MKTKHLIIVLGVAGFIVMADNWVVSPLLPTISNSFGVDPVRAGILISAYMLPFGLFQLVYGPLADRFGKLKIIGISLVLFTLATTLCGFGFGLADLTAYRALTGAFAAATLPVGLAVVGDLVPMEQRQQAIATFMGVAFLGQAASMTIGGAIAYVSSWRGVFWAYGAASAVITVLVLFSIRRFGSALTGDPHSEFLRPYGRLLSHGSSIKTYLVTLIEGVLVLGSFSYMGTEATRALGLNNLGIGLLMAVFGLGVIVGSRAAGPLAKRVERRLLVAAGLTLAAAADLMVFLAPGQLVLTAAALLLMGLGFMFAHSSLLTTATQFAPKARGTAMSLVAFSFMVGGAMGTLLGGRLIVGLGFNRFYLAFGVVLVCLGLAAFLVLPRDRHPGEIGVDGAPYTEHDGPQIRSAVAPVAASPTPLPAGTGESTG